MAVHFGLLARGDPGSSQEGSTRVGGWRIVVAGLPPAGGPTWGRAGGAGRALSGARKCRRRRGLAPAPQGRPLTTAARPAAPSAPPARRPAPRPPAGSERPSEPP